MTTQFHNYYVDKIGGKQILSGIRDKLAVARAGGNELAWLEVKTHIKSYLKEADSKYLLDAMASIRREDKLELIAWVLFMKDLRRVSTKGVLLPQQEFGAHCFWDRWESPKGQQVNPTCRKLTVNVSFLYTQNS
jgi:hypothetical protein